MSNILRSQLQQQIPLHLSQQLLTEKSIQILLTKKQTNLQKIPLPHKQLLQTHESQVITVPIKQYSNKFLREKKKQQTQANQKKKQPFLNSHLHNNRKLISDFKKYKGRNEKFGKSVNKENKDFIIHNLLFDKNQNLLPLNNHHQKTIFGNFAQNSHSQSIHQLSNEDSTLFDKGWKTAKNQNPFQTKKEVYEKICEKEKSFIPEYRKKSKTIAQVPNLQNRQDKDKKIERISTSRALQKYSKIIKVNPQHGKIEKMKIKKELAKSLRFESNQKGDFETKQIILSKKQTPHRIKNNSVLQEISRNYSIDCAMNQNEKNPHNLKTPEKNQYKGKGSKQNQYSGKAGLFTAGSKLKKLRKFSHQIQLYKKCVTEQRMFDQNDQSFQDFEINGWDINF